MRTMKYFILFFPIVFFLTSCHSLKETLKGQYKNYRAKLILDIPKEYKKDYVAVEVEKNFRTKCGGDVIKKENKFPERLPKTTENPIWINTGMNNMIALCHNSWIEISCDESLNMSLFGIYRSGIYKACIYPYNNGYKVFVFAKYELKSNVIGNILLFDNPIKRKREEETIAYFKKALGKYAYICDDRIFNCWFDIVLLNLKKSFPQSKILYIRYPQKRKEGGSLSIDKYKN